LLAAIALVKTAFIGCSSSSCNLMQSPPQQQVSVGQKRKPDETLTGNVAQFVDNSNLFHLTLSKIFTPPPKRTGKCV